MAAESVWKLGGLKVPELGKRLWSEIQKDNVLEHSAALAYYFTFALFPMMLFLVSLLGMMAGPGSSIRESLMHYLSTVLPGSASQLIQTTLTEITKASSGGKLSLGLILALWSASAGVAALVDALNVTYDVKEGRPFWKVRAIAIGLTLALSVLVISALTLVLYGGTIADLVGNIIHLGTAFTMAWKIVQWPVAIFFLLLSFALMYFFGPNVEQRKWYWVTPGAVLGVLLWLVASLAFKAYLHYFNNYSATYGSLGAVIILLTWLYVTGMAILIGAEINSEIEHRGGRTWRYGSEGRRRQGSTRRDGRKAAATTDPEATSGLEQPAVRQPVTRNINLLSLGAWPP